MPATATSFGDGVFGINADQTGFIIESISYNYSSDKKTVKNRTGNDSGVTFYNEKLTIDMNRKVPKTSPFPGTIAASLTHGNALSAYLKGGVTGGLTLVDTINVELNQEDYQGIKVTSTYYPNISA